MSDRPRPVRRTGFPTWAWYAVVFASGLFADPLVAVAQGRWKSAHVQVAANPGRFGGLGFALVAEVGAFGPVRASVQRVDWQAVQSCVVLHAPSECNNEPVLWEVGGRLELGRSEKVAPFIGGGIGIYRRTWFTTRGPGIRILNTPDRASSPSLSLTAGMDIAILKPVSIRVSVMHQEVFDADLERIYGRRVRFSGFLVGLGLATW